MGTTIGGVWSNWKPKRSLPGTSLSTDLTVASNKDGFLEVFVIASDSRVYHIWQFTVKEEKQYN